MKYTEICALAQELRLKLHSIPEISGQEVKTRQTLIEFIKTHTSLEIIDCGPGFYAAHREENASKPSIALRADYDALPLPDGGAAHLCGHDGHAAALAAAALLLEGCKIGRDVFFLWQPAEETGEGAAKCLSIFENEMVGSIYGAHNLPGFPTGEIFTRQGTFACASRGVTLLFTGEPTHAAYPELGISPAETLGKVLTALPELSEKTLYSGMTICTVIGAQMGQKAFGKAAERAELWLTLRSERDEDLKALQERIVNTAKCLAGENGLEFSVEEQDVFPATVNDKDCAGHLIETLNGHILKAPMRWSEDFGHYLKHCKGAFFGVGAGEDYPGLHTARYCYPDEILMTTAEAFLRLIN